MKRIIGMAAAFCTMMVAAMAAITTAPLTHATLSGSPVSSVTPHVADFTLTAADSGTTHTTKGATGTVVCSLPAATVGLKFKFYVGAVQELRIDPSGTETISLPSSGAAQAAGAYLTANAIGETVTIECCEAGTWAVMSSVGTWTAV